MKVLNVYDTKRLFSIPRMVTDPAVSIKDLDSILLNHNPLFCILRILLSETCLIKDIV